MSTLLNPEQAGLLPTGLYALVDDGVRTDWSLVQKAQAALEGGVRVLQLRMKRTPPREAIAAGREVTGLCRARGAVCIINDRVDYVLLTGAHGVHLGDEDLPPREARRLLGPGRLVGVTTRSLEDVRRAAEEGADNVGLGPIFPTRTKQVAHEPLGLARLEAIAANSPLPIVAIAGITLDRIAEVASRGAHAAAVASDLFEAGDPAEQARRLIAAFESGRSRRSIADAT